MSNLSNAAYLSRIFSHSHTRYQLALSWLWRVWFFILCSIHRLRFRMAAILQTTFSKPLLITKMCCISFLILLKVIPQGSTKISHTGLSISLTWNRWQAIIRKDDIVYWSICVSHPRWVKNIAFIIYTLNTYVFLMFNFGWISLYIYLKFQEFTWYEINFSYIPNILYCLHHSPSVVWMPAHQCTIWDGTKLNRNDAHWHQSLTLERLTQRFGGRWLSTRNEGILRQFRVKCHQRLIIARVAVGSKL